MDVIINTLPALEGFFTIGVLIGLGWLLARLGVLTIEHRKLMSLLALYVASPALLYSMMVDADLSRVFSQPVIAAYGSIALVAVTYIIANVIRLKHKFGEATMGTLLAAYSNAGNLGIPVAAYALRDVTWIVPVLLIQVGVLQPAALAIFDYRQMRMSGKTVSIAKVLTVPLRNPLTVGVLVGLLGNLLRSRWEWFALPEFAAHPVTMLGAAAIPLMLLAFGVSLCLDPKPAKGAETKESWFIVALKVLIQPVYAFILAAFVLRLDPIAVRAVTVIASLPPAQNLFVFASRYEIRMVFARDTIFRATIVSIASVLLATILLS
ncbi:MAG: AEC family transporter [Propionibacteriaceae bacterium]|nr:AEC family transporter [Propionibacteriaceae bacterium]